MQWVKDNAIEVISGIVLVYFFIARDGFFIDIIKNIGTFLAGAVILLGIIFVLSKIKNRFHIENFTLKIFSIYAVFYFLYIFITKDVPRPSYMP